MFTKMEEKKVIYSDVLSEKFEKGINLPHSIFKLLDQRLTTDTGAVESVILDSAYTYDYNDETGKEDNQAERIDNYYDEQQDKIHQGWKELQIDNPYIRISQDPTDDASFRITIQHDSALIALQVY